MLLAEKVVLVTGAGNGIGRAHALALARAGARVVVNDLGGTVDGSGADVSAAQEVVDEIRALGGDAVASVDSVTDPAGAERMVRAALDRWGRLDAVVNNAGILRDRTFVKLSAEDFDLVLDVHLRGTVNVCRAAVPWLQKQGGAIVNTTSYSGMIGNFGQSNYAAAKAGIYGLTRVLSMELRKSGVTANCIAPIAKTRMTESLAMLEAEWTAEQISPVVVFRDSDLAKSLPGQVIGVLGQRLHVYEVKVNDGVEKAGKELWTPEEIAAAWDRIASFAPAAPAPAAAGPDPVKEVFAYAPAAFLPERAGDFAAVIHWKLSDHPGMTLVVREGRVRVEEGLVGSPDCTVKSDQATVVGVFSQTLDPQKAFMSGKMAADNLGVLMKFAMFFDFAKGAAAAKGGAPPAAGPPSPPPAEAPKAWPIGKIYDGGAKFAEPAHALAYAAATGDDAPAYAAGLCPPMFHVRLFKELMFQVATDPELGLDLLRLVHGEHDAIFHRPIHHWDLVQLRARLEGVEEKASGRLVSSRLFGFVDGQLAVEARTVYFIRGPKKGEAEARLAEPERGAPAFELPLEIAPDQSLRYAAASLDDNPIHTDPDTAAAAGLPGVILQGLCTMAMTGAAFVRAAAGADPTRLRRLAVRFARPVLNGSRLSTRAWREDGAWALETRDEAGKLVLSQGRAELG